MSSSDWIQILVGACIVAGVTALFWRTTKRADVAATTATTMGILCTFAGISYALIRFDPQPDSLSSSIPGLLDGMRIAFTTSVWGMLLNVAIRYWDSRPQRGQTESDFADEIRERLQQTIDALRLSVEQSQEAQRAISSLGNVVELSQNLQEQLGEQVQTLSKHGSDRDELLALIANRQDGLSSSLSEANAAQVALTASMKAQSGESAQVVRDLASVLSSIGDTVEASHRRIEESAEAIMGSNESVVAALTQSSSELMTQSQQHLADTVSEIARAHTSVATTLENSATHVAESSDLLHSTLEDALSTSLHTLSSSLASISAKFAMDYGQVADYLRDIVQMAGKAHDDDDAPG